MAYKRGKDTSATRLGGFEKQLLTTLLSYHGNVRRVVDLGSGTGRLSIMLALAGFEVFAVDTQDYRRHLSRINEALPLRKPITFLQEPAEAGGWHAHAPFGAIIANRLLHHLPYQSQQTLLRQIPTLLAEGGYFAAIVSTTDSFFAKGYPKELPPQKRWHTIAPELQEQAELYEPVCLLSEKEWQALFAPLGLQLLQWERSRFGNLHILLQKPSRAVQ